MKIDVKTIQTIVVEVRDHLEVAALEEAILAVEDSMVEMIGEEVDLMEDLVVLILEIYSLNLETVVETICQTKDQIWIDKKRMLRDLI